MIASVSAYLRAVLYFEYQENGWSEVYDLVAGDVANGLVALMELAQYRRSFLGFGVSITWGRLSWSDNHALAYSLPGLPLGFMSSMKDAPSDADADYCPNDPYIAIVYRFETTSRRWANRLWVGIPDNMVYDFRAAGIVSHPLPPGLPLAAPGNPDGQSADYYRASFLRWLLTNTNYTRLETDPEAAAPSWEIEEWHAAKDHPLGFRRARPPFVQCRGRALAA